MSYPVIPQCRTLGELKRQCFGGRHAPALLEHLQDDLAVSVQRYHFGQVIIDGHQPLPGESRQDHFTLRVVIEGEAEVCDMSRYSNVSAYRPIRVLPKGAVFGDFVIVDELLGIGMPAGSRETWQLVAGRRCLVATQEVDKGLGFGRTASPNEFSRLLHERGAMPPVDIAEITIPADAVARTGPQSALLFRSDLLAHAWRGAKPYRDGLNSFNFAALLDFRREAMCLASNAGTKDSTKDSKQARLSDMLNPFADALFDAINRPLRGEPLFEVGLPTWMKETASACLKRHDIKEMCMLSACAAFGGDSFLFPLDLHNIFVNKAVSFERKSIVDEAALNRFSRAVDILYPTRYAKIQPRPVRFYMGLAAALIASYQDRHPDYPYWLHCEYRRGATRPMMVLCYRKKTA